MPGLVGHRKFAGLFLKFANLRRSVTIARQPKANPNFVFGNRNLSGNTATPIPEGKWLLRSKLPLLPSRRPSRDRCAQIAALCRETDHPDSAGLMRFVGAIWVYSRSFFSSLV